MSYPRCERWVRQERRCPSTAFAGSPMGSAGTSRSARCLAEPTCAPHSSSPLPQCRYGSGEPSCATLGASVAAYDASGAEVIDEVGELVLTKPMPSMPVSFWKDPDGSRLRKAYFADFPALWRHGDWVRKTPRGSFVIYGRSDSTLNRGGVRMERPTSMPWLKALRRSSIPWWSIPPNSAPQTKVSCSASWYSRRVPRWPMSSRSCGSHYATSCRRGMCRTNSSPSMRSRTPSTVKKCEVPVKRILAGVDPDRAVSRDALSNPDSLDPFIRMARH